MTAHTGCIIRSLLSIGILIVIISYRTKTFEDGDHKICFDNTFSIFSAKTVFFEISTDNDDDEDDNGEIKIDKKNNDVWGDTDQAFYAGLRPEEIYDIHVQDIKVLPVYQEFQQLLTDFLNNNIRTQLLQSEEN